MTATDTAARGHEAGQVLRFGVRGMTCASCVRRVERALASVPGVERASVNLATEEATVTVLDAAAADGEALRAAVDRAGYTLRTRKAGEDETQAHDRVEAERHADLRALQLRTWSALAAAAFLMAGMQWCTSQGWRMCQRGPCTRCSSSSRRRCSSGRAGDSTRGPGVPAVMGRRT